MDLRVISKCIWSQTTNYSLAKKLNNKKQLNWKKKKIWFTRYEEQQLKLKFNWINNWMLITHSFQP